jgi:hypothetical protein
MLKQTVSNNHRILNCYSTVVILLNLHYHETFLNFALIYISYILYNFSMFAPLYNIDSLVLQRLIEHVFCDEEFST